MLKLYKYFLKICNNNIFIIKHVVSSACIIAYFQSQTHYKCKPVMDVWTKTIIQRFQRSFVKRRWEKLKGFDMALGIEHLGHWFH